MAIGDLYDAQNVKVGQAAVMVAPQNTPLPVISATVPNMVDPFSIQPWSQAVLTASGALTAGTFTLTYTVDGVAYTTASIQWNATNAAIQSAIITALATYPQGAPTAAQVLVTGGALTVPTPIAISLDETFLSLSGLFGTWTLTPTGITGGTLSITNPVWTPVGATDQGWTWGASKSLQDITIEEQSTLVGRLITSQSITITGALSEDISNTLGMVVNMTQAYTAQSVSNPGYTTLTLTDTVLQYAVALLTSNVLTFPRWIYIPIAVCLDNVSVPFRRAAAKRMYSAQFASICATSAIQVFDFEHLHS